MDFEAFPKIPRLNRDIVITEKIDGTNAAVLIEDVTDFSYHGFSVGDPDVVQIVESDMLFRVQAQSRKRLITPESDNFGFARWVRDNAEELVRLLGPGRHFGEWWGRGIQRGYGLDHKRFSLFNPARYAELAGPAFAPLYPQIGIVPVLYEGPFWPIDDRIGIEPTPWHEALWELCNTGSAAAPGFMNPEGIVVYHTAARQSFKVTVKDDDKPKGSAE